MVMSETVSSKKKGAMRAFLAWVEWLGNLLPHPITLFALLVLAVLLLSGIAGLLEISVMDPRPEGARGRSPDGVIHAVSLLNGAGLRRIIENMVTNFTSFAPLGVVLVVMLGVGVAEASGLLKTMIRALVLITPAKLITMSLVFCGILSNVASDMGYVVLVPLGGFIFHTLGRHPLAGMAATFAGVSGGYSANLILGTLDPLLAGITQEAAQLLDPDYTVHPAANWYFMIGSTFLITIVGTWVSSSIVEPGLGTYQASADMAQPSGEDHLRPLSADEKRGLFYAFIALLGLCALISLTVVPSWGALRDPNTGEVLNSPFIRGIVSMIVVLFFVPSVVYGFVVKKFKSDVDVINGMSTAMESMAMYIVLTFFAAQFVAYFNWTNLGIITAVAGADVLKSVGFTGGIILFPFILLCGFVNLLVGSASAKWALTAPIFVPMLMLLGFSPELTQAAYRIGDSVSNIITPLMSYFAIILAFAHRFDKNIGIGTIISTMLPFSIFFTIAWTIFLYLWIYVLQIPLGPGIKIFYP
jgi:aminobenzoyl-glutamate transport protein